MNRRRFLRGAAAIALLPGMTRAGLITQSGARYFPAAQGGGGNEIDYDYPAVTHIVSPSGAGLGNGSSELNAMSITDFCALNTNSGTVHGECIPGDYALTLNVDGGKLRPTNANHATNLWICRARNPSTTADPGDCCNFTVASGGTSDTSSIFGFGARNSAGLATRNAIWDGFRSVEHNGRTNDESASVAIWRTTDCYLRRCTVEIAGAGAGFDYNMGAVFAESNTRLWIEDCQFGESEAGGENGALVLFYGLMGGGVRFSRFYNCAGTGIFLKGQPSGDLNHSTRLNNNDFNNIGDTVGGDNSCINIYDATPSDPTNKALCNWVFQNIFRNGAGYGLRTQTLSDDSPRGWIWANNLAYAMQSAGLCLDRFISGPQYDPLAELWNNLLVNCGYGIELLDAGWDSEMGNVQAHFTRFHGNTSGILSEGGSPMSLATFQSKANEEGSTSGDPSFVNAGAGNFRLQAGSNCRNAGEDYLQLLGGAQDAPIHLGPYITDDTIIGPRDQA